MATAGDAPPMVGAAMVGATENLTTELAQASGHKQLLVQQKDC